MNVERIKQLRDRIAALPPNRFNLAFWFSNESRPDFDFFIGKTNKEAAEGSCGSCACIAGHALAMFAPNEPVTPDPGLAARHLLELTFDQASALFEPINSIFWDEPYLIPIQREQVTNQQAVIVLDHLIATGEVDWRIAFQ